MEQHKNFSMCRIPGKSVDTVRKAPFTESRHVIVIRNGHVSLSCVMYLYSNHMHMHGDILNVKNSNVMDKRVTVV